MNHRAKYVLWVLQTGLMIPSGLLFVIAPFTSADDDIAGWIGEGLVALIGVMILCVEGWFWWNRLFRSGD